jgi:hypothetical protein
MNLKSVLTSLFFILKFDYSECIYSMHMQPKKFNFEFMSHLYVIICNNTSKNTNQPFLPSFFSQFQKTAHAGSVSVAESLYKNKSSLEAIFRILDKDNSGQISLEEFEDACELLRTHLVEHGTIEQLMEMCKMMDINKDGLVDLNEFLETFRLCQMNAGRPSYDYRGGTATGEMSTTLNKVGSSNEGAISKPKNGVQEKKDKNDSDQSDYEDYDSTASRKGKKTKKTKCKVSIEGNGKVVDGVIDDNVKSDKKSKTMFI